MFDNIIRYAMISYLMYIEKNVTIGWGIFSVLIPVNVNSLICPVGGGYV